MPFLKGLIKSSLYSPIISLFLGRKFFRKYILNCTIFLPRLVKLTQLFFKIIVPEFNGVKLSSLSGIEGNEFYIEKILHLYMKTWNSKESFAIHGDFAFGNFIFGDNEVHIIDWEHFHKSNIQNYSRILKELTSHVL